MLRVRASEPHLYTGGAGNPMTILRLMTLILWNSFQGLWMGSARRAMVCESPPHEPWSRKRVRGSDIVKGLSVEGQGNNLRWTCTYCSLSLPVSELDLENQ